MFPTSGWVGQTLQTALSEPPQMTLTFYSYGILLKKQLADGTFTEHPVDAAHIAQALSAKVTFETGLRDGDMLFVRQTGLRQLVIGYRKPQLTGVWLEGQGEALRVPLPGLVMVQAVVDARPTQTHVYAVKRRPTSLTAPLYHAPLPNVFNSGSVCWGSVPQTASMGLSLTATWARLFGTAFGGHATSGKSRIYPQDICEGLLALAKQTQRTYPRPDLMAAEMTLAKLVERGRDD